MREVLAFRAVRRSWSSWRKILSGTLRLARHNCSSAAVSLSAFSGGLMTRVFPSYPIVLLAYGLGFPLIWNEFDMFTRY